MPKLFTPSSTDLTRMVDTAMAKFDRSQTIRRMYPNLQKYVERYNIETKLFYGQGETFDLAHLTHAAKAKLMQHVECDLSPENLCCDGELSGAKLRQKAQYLNAVKAELTSFVCL